MIGLHEAIGELQEHVVALESRVRFLEERLMKFAKEGISE